MQRGLKRAREDLKKKRTAPDNGSLATTSKRKKPFISERKPGQPTAPASKKENPGELLKYSKRITTRSVDPAEFGICRRTRSRTD